MRAAVIWLRKSNLHANSPDFLHPMLLPHLSLRALKEPKIKVAKNRTGQEGVEGGFPIFRLINRLVFITNRAEY